ncbi:hypothetical protein JOB18_034423 [Solea senegalensis]|uniref:Uncharacterized protein n=1 Tax=Solea senegalensis TaxID=28829 RepID=A0AAV6T8W2_SOLSE|nr:hypothetical protein JOB18_034423 [Solea senegalensis]
MADLSTKLCIPAEIASTNLRPDLVLWSASLKLVYIIKLTVPWESAVEDAYERQKLSCVRLSLLLQELTSECLDHCDDNDNASQHRTPSVVSVSRCPQLTTD